MNQKPRLKKEEKKGFEKTHLFFIGQTLAFWLLVIGFLVFVWIWYKG